jgi:hypothetical protein
MPLDDTCIGGLRPARAVCVVLALAGGLLACGSSELGVQQGRSPTEVFEGSNFYDTGLADGEPMVPHGSPMVPSNAPGFVEFVSGEENLSACVVGAEGERVRESAGEPSLACAPVILPGISDFTPAGSADNVTFGASSSVSGGTYFYPTDGLSSDVTGGDWHLTGTVSAISGFGLYLSGCAQLDASAYRGIAFNLWGEIGAGGSLVFFTGTAANQVSREWIDDNDASGTDEPDNLGRCVPVSTRYDGSCREPRATLVVGETPAQVEVLWRDLTEGCPVSTVDPREITSIAWYLPPAATGPYSVDIHIDDLRFTDGAPL